MALPSPFKDLFILGADIMSSALASTGAILIQLGDVVASTVDSDRAEWWQHTGFRSMPANPDSGSAACQVIAIRRADRDRVFATMDARHSSIWKDLNPDEAMIFSFKGSVRTVCRANGTVEIGTLDPQDFAAIARIVDAQITKLAEALNGHLHTSGTPSSPTGPAYVTAPTNTPVVTNGGTATLPVVLDKTVASQTVKVSP